VLVLFDLDDTLLDDRTATRIAASLLHRRLGGPSSLDAFVAAWAKALAAYFPPYLAGELTFQGQRRERLRQVTGTPVSDEEADRVFEQYLADYQGAWSLFPECGFTKPHSEIFRHACALAREEPRNAIHVGDRYDLDDHLPPKIRSLTELAPELLL
jgi:FMN phosphatase YigB (HAD superfamily)